MEYRALLAAYTFCFLLGFAYTMFILGSGRYQPSRFNFAAMACGFESYLTKPINFEQVLAVLDAHGHEAVT